MIILIAKKINMFEWFYAVLIVNKVQTKRLLFSFFLSVSLFAKTAAI